MIAKVQTDVGLLLPSLHGGGAERVMLNLARGFAEQGLKTDIVLASATGSFLPQVPKGIRIVDLQAKRVVNSIPALVRYLRRDRPMALLSALDHVNLAALWARELAGTKTRIVITVHNTLTRALHDPAQRRGRLIPFLIRRWYSKADWIIAVSRGVADDLARLARLPSERIQVIYNPVVTPEILEQAAAVLDHPWFGPDEPPVILGVGRLTFQKDFATLICAVHLISKNFPVRLIILGEGEERPRIERLIAKMGLQNEVSLPGFVSNPFAYMARAAVFVLSSAWEGLPTVLIEAMACGCPVVSTDCPSGPAEILEGGRLGRLIPIGDIQALADAIRETLAHPPDREQLKRSGQRFLMDKAVSQYLESIGVTS